MATVMKKFRNNGILKGGPPLSGFQRQSLWQGVGQRPTINKVLRKRGELQNSPGDCFVRENALQEKAFPKSI